MQTMTTAASARVRVQQQQQQQYIYNPLWITYLHESDPVTLLYNVFAMFAFVKHTAPPPRSRTEKSLPVVWLASSNAL